MIWRVVLTPRAQDKFDQAFDFYENRRSGLGHQFASAVQETIDRIAVRPEMDPLILNDIRRARVQGHPYCLYYFVDEIEERVEIATVFHTSRDPSGWQSLG